MANYREVSIFWSSRFLPFGLPWNTSYTYFSSVRFTLVNGTVSHLFMRIIIIINSVLGSLSSIYLGSIFFHINLIKSIKGFTRSKRSETIRRQSFIYFDAMILTSTLMKKKSDDSSGKGVQNFHREILIMKSIGYHQNIVSMVGCCTIDVARPMLVVEYCSQGDLHTYLRTVSLKRTFQ